MVDRLFRAFRRVAARRFRLSCHPGLLFGIRLGATNGQARGSPFLATSGSAASEWTHEPELGLSPSAWAEPEKLLHHVPLRHLGAATAKGDQTMKYLLVGLGLLAAAPAFFPSAAEAVVCARGVYRSGCAGPNGAVVRRHPAYVAPRPAYVAPGAVYVAPVHGCRWVWRYGQRVRICS
jgi:hypothetical protein